MNSSDDYSYDEDSEWEAVRWKRTENRYGKPTGTKKTRTGTGTGMKSYPRRV